MLTAHAGQGCLQKVHIQLWQGLSGAGDALHVSNLLCMLEHLTVLLQDCRGLQKTVGMIQILNYPAQHGCPDTASTCSCIRT